MALFDFPDPNATSEQRMVTVGPMQRLFFMNNEFVGNRAKALAERTAREGDTAARITFAYRLLYGREPKAMSFDSAPSSWPRGKARGRSICRCCWHRLSSAQ
jgi:hypothetical protein